MHPPGWVAAIAMLCAGCGAALDARIVEAGRRDTASELACAGPIDIAPDGTLVEQCVEHVWVWQGPDGVIQEPPCVRTALAPVQDVYVIRGCGRSVTRMCGPRCDGEIVCLSDLEWALLDCPTY